MDQPTSTLPGASLNDHDVYIVGQDGSLINVKSLPENKPAPGGWGDGDENDKTEF